jgi:hypothetical protein
MHAAIKKLFRLADQALVVYRGTLLIGVKHLAVSPWQVWNKNLLCWDKAPPDAARDFEHLPLAGSVKD